MADLSNASSLMSIFAPRGGAGVVGGGGAGWDGVEEAAVAGEDDQLVLAAGEDFAILGVTRFAVAYLGTRVTKIKPLDPNSAMKPSTTRIKGVVIELHGVAEPVRLFRQIIRPPRGQPVLAAAVALDPPLDSPYADVLPRAIASCANDAEATVH